MSIGEQGISQEQYEQGIAERVMPDEVNVSAAYIFRALTPPEQQPPYAIETFGVVRKLQATTVEPGVRLITLDVDRPRGIVKFPMDREGFIVTRNEGPNRNPSAPEGILQIGYFLGHTSLNQTELYLLATETPIPRT